MQQQMYNHKGYKSLVGFLVFVFLITTISTAFAAQVDYGDGPIVDTDLDGLTDKGEEQIFHTNPRLPDTDGDGFYDGLEVIMNTDPLTVFGVGESEFISRPEPIAWWLSRITGLIAYVLLTLVVFLGFSFRTPFLRKIVAPVYKLDFHKFLSLLATVFILLHMIVLLFDEYTNFSLADILIPFHAQSQVVDISALAAGIIAFYGVIVLVTTSLISRKYFPHGLWRTLHFIHSVVYVLIVIHILQIGTDVEGGVGRAIFVTSVIVTGAMYPIGLFFTIRDMIRLRRKN